MKKTLISLGIYGAVGAVIALLLGWARGAFPVLEAKLTLMLLSDGFFTVGGLLLCWGILTWTANGGVWDGLTFTFKNMIGRMKKQFESERKTFAQYQEERMAKARSPKDTLLGGLLHTAIALILYFCYASL